MRDLRQFRVADEMPPCIMNCTDKFILQNSHCDAFLYWSHFVFFFFKCRIEKLIVRLLFVHFENEKLRISLYSLRDKAQIPFANINMTFVSTKALDRIAYTRRNNVEPQNVHCILAKFSQSYSKEVSDTCLVHDFKRTPWIGSYL